MSTTARSRSRNASNSSTRSKSPEGDQCSDASTKVQGKRNFRYVFDEDQVEDIYNWYANSRALWDTKDQEYHSLSGPEKMSNYYDVKAKDFPHCSG